MPGSKVTPKQKVDDPVGNFASHADVVKHDALSAKQKMDVLKERKRAAVRLSVATEAGLSGGEPARLDEVKDAQFKLAHKAAKRPASPTKAG